MGMLQMMLLTWGVITAVLICVMIYRSTPRWWRQRATP